MLHDLRYAWRLLVKTPGFTTIAVLTLSIGIGLATTVFNAMSAMALRPLPHIRDEGRVVSVVPFIEKSPDSKLGFSVPDYLEVRDATRTLTGLSLVSDRTIVIGGTPPPQRLLGTFISATGFDMLGVKPWRGRLFVPADEASDAPPVVILSHQLWTQRFAGSDNVLGRTLLLNGSPATVVGVLPEGFRFPENSDLWTPFLYDQKAYPRGAFSFFGFARMRDGATLDDVQNELAQLGRQLAARHPATNDGVSLHAKAMRHETTRDVTLLVCIMIFAVTFVLLMACANVANLLLARAATRSHEMAIRSALGATRTRIIRQVLTESVVLSLLGAAGGLLVALWLNGLMVSKLPADLPYWMNFAFDWRVFVFATLAALVSAVVFGAFPAWQVSPPPAARLKEGGRGGTASARTHRVRNVLVIMQVATALVLLIGAGLMVRSFLNLQRADFGIDPRQVLTFRVGLPPTQYPDHEFVRRFFEQSDQKLRELPGVRSVGYASLLPGTSVSIMAFQVEGRPKPRSLMESPFTVMRTASPGYFETFKLRLIRGRLLDDRDGAGPPWSIVVDQAFVDQWFPGEDPLGRQITFSEGDEGRDTVTIVGVVGNAPQRLLGSAPYFNCYLHPGPHTGHFQSFVLKVDGDPLSYVAAAQRAILSVQPDVPIYYAQSMDQVLERSYWDRKFFGQIFSAFGLGALILASLGIYGVMAFTVSQRTQEIGVRMALGAQPGQVIRMIYHQGMRLIGTGLLIGLIFALILTRTLSGFLYQVGTSDPLTYLFFSLVLATVGMIACVLPARRATEIAPMSALRNE